MALIKCPECGKEISDKAKCCIHCGYPLDEISSNEYKDISTRECLTEKEDTHNFSQKINSSFDKINYTQKQPETLRDLVQKRDSETKNIEIVESQPIPKPTPKCPTCGSTDISKISATSKAVSVGLFGIFSPKIRKQFHCNSCKYEW